MVTTRQVFRGAARTMRAIDREAKRSQARRIAYERSAQKIALLEEAADAADEYQHMIDQLVGAHRIAFRPIDWAALAQRPGRWTGTAGAGLRRLRMGDRGRTAATPDQ
jgi:hypothetical protein